jgi:hypothetical protein
MDNNTSNTSCPTDIDETPWLDDDRKWFAKNPRRNFRLREAHPLERIELGITDTRPWVWNGVIVNQIVPGARTRTLFASYSGAPENTDKKAIEIITICNANEAGDA